jgi:Uncharacterised nucleotidyltransferase
MLASGRDKLTGCVVADVLAQSWRMCPASIGFSKYMISDIAPPMLKSGGAALVWWRLQAAAPRLGDALIPYQQAHRYYTVRAGFYEAQIRKVFTLFRSHAMEPVLVKGWSIGRCYPTKGLRPYGDIDLCIHESDYQKALELAATPEGQRFHLDLHKELEELDSRKYDEFFERTQLVTLREMMVRIPSDEDLLRIVCLHLLRHGGWRPLQFCDVAVLLETRSPEFRWEICVGNSRREINWISTVIGLAHHLLGASLEGYPFAEEARRIPRWLIAQVLKSWETPAPTMNAPLNYGKPLRDYLREPRGLLSAVKRRWPNPIAATYSVKGSFNNLPRFPYQLAESLRRATRFLIPLA